MTQRTTKGWIWRFKMVQIMVIGNTGMSEVSLVRDLIGVITGKIMLEAMILVLVITNHEIAVDYILLKDYIAIAYIPGPGKMAIDKRTFREPAWPRTCYSKTDTEIEQPMETEFCKRTCYVTIYC